MNQSTMPYDLALRSTSGGSDAPTFMPAWLCRLARRLVFSRLARLEAGKLMIVEGGESYVFGAMTEPGQLSATVTINDVRTYLNLALGGTVGGGEAYRRGYWSCDNLTALVRIFALNREVVEGMESGLAILTRPLLKVLHRLNRNSRDGSRRNIAAHYDLGNDFYRLMLDETMMYSCAYFERPDATLAEASRTKIERICRKLELSPSDHLLEIGTGWGGFAIHAASQYGCRVTTATISRQQFDLATQRVREAGLSDRITVLLIDYRDLPKLQTRFDKLVSIEMIEAVGHEYYGTFFDICSRMLKPNGLMLMQGITIDERFYERAKRSVDFIQHFIFPGSCIPSISALVSASSRAGDLGLIHLEDIGCHYPRTLKEWRERFTGAIRTSGLWDTAGSSSASGNFTSVTAKEASWNDRSAPSIFFSPNPDGVRPPCDLRPDAARYTSSPAKAHSYSHVKPLVYRHELFPPRWGHR